MAKTAITAMVAILLSACGSVETCDEVENYQLAREGERVAVPPDLDNLSPTKELRIPEPSARPPRPANAGCIDKPPGVMNTSGSS